MVHGAARTRDSLHKLLNCPLRSSPALRSHETCVNPEEPDFNPCVEHYRAIGEPSSSSSAASSASAYSSSGRNSSSFSGDRNTLDGGSARNGGDSQGSASSDGAPAPSEEKANESDPDDGYYSNGRCTEDSMHSLPAGTVCDNESYK